MGSGLWGRHTHSCTGGGRRQQEEDWGADEGGSDCEEVSFTPQETHC